MISGPLHAYLAGTKPDGRNRSLEEVLAFSDDDLERVHDYIQWLFPLPTRSSAQPSAPVLTPDEIVAIRADEKAQANLRRAAARMLAFYDATQWWLASSDHNHLRITRILQSLRLLAGQEAAQEFYDAILTRHRAAGSPINPHNLRYWTAAMNVQPSRDD
jgi:hypothetical protein